MNRTHLAAAMTVCMIGAVGTAFAQRPAASMSFFVTSSNPKGGNLGGLAGGDAALPVAGASRGRGRQDLARLSEHQHGGREDANRQRALVQLQGRADCEQRGGPAQREQQDHGVDGAHREGHDAELPRGQPACNPSRSRCSTTSSPARTRTARRTRTPASDWTVGDAEREGDARPRRSPGPQRRREFVERRFTPRRGAAWSSSRRRAGRACCTASRPTERNPQNNYLRGAFHRRR